MQNDVSATMSVGRAVVRLPSELLDGLGVEEFDGFFERAVTVEAFGRTIRVASISDLIAMKRVAGRAKDLDHIEELESL